MEKKPLKFISVLTIGLVAVVLTAAVIMLYLRQDTQPADVDGIVDDPSVTKLTVWDTDGDFTELLYGHYKEMHPEFKYEINSIIYGGTADPPPGYEWLEEQFRNEGEDVPDIIYINKPEAVRYIDGDMSEFMAAYEELGIDVDRLLAKNKIPQYLIDEGSNADGELMALPSIIYSSAFIYRRSIAIDVWGTDDPKFVADKIGPGWEKFLSAAEELKAKGYRILSTAQDIWTVTMYSAEQGWVKNGMLYIDPQREAYLDIAKELTDKGYVGSAEGTWTDPWYTDMQGAGEEPVFGYFGPSFMINYVIENWCGGTKPGEGTYGDWAVCLPTFGYSYNSACIMANKNTKLKKTVADIIEWMTLDSSETGAQYLIAKGLDNKPEPKMMTVPSGVLMKKLDASLDILGGQDMFDIYLQAGKMAKRKIMTENDEMIDIYWNNAVTDYAKGNKTREQAVMDFKRIVKDTFRIPFE